VQVWEGLKHESQTKNRLTPFEEWVNKHDPREFSFSDDLLQEFLAIGKEKTKQYYVDLNWAQKRLYLRRVRRFGFNSLAAFLVS
jgi:hypothetical protein